MATLEDRSVDDTYKNLLQIDNSNAGVDGTLRAVEDGEGTESALMLSTAGVKFTGTVAYDSYSVAFGGNFSTGGAFTTSAFALTLTTTATTNVTLPTTGTLSTLAGAESLSNKTLVTPILGTPASGNLSNCTAYPTDQLTGAGTGVLTFLATPSSSNLLAAVTDETGTGALVFSISPTLTTPIIGVATATSVNKVAITAPATSATLTIANGKTLTASNTLTLSGTDASTMNLSTGGSVETGTNWTPGFTGFSSNPTYGTCTYQKIGKRVFINMVVSSNGTSNTTGFTITGLPFTAAYTSYKQTLGTDSGTTTFVTLIISGTTITLCKGTSITAATWTASGNKGAEIHFDYETTA